MVGIALEGGGAKGAYQAGAYIALVQNGIKPKIIAGTSIGSINAALMAQGDIDKLVKLWLNTTTDIFGINSELVAKIKKKEFNKEDIKLGFKNIKKIISQKGIDTTEILRVLNENIDEEKLRKSKTKFGLITVKAKTLEPLELVIDEIPKGKIPEYILASCYLPIFTMKPIIDNNYYIDGGFYNNVPLSLLENYGCDTIYSIRIKGIGFQRNHLKPDTKVIEIKPKKSLGSMIIFDKESNKKNMQLGYYDTMKVLKNLDGDDYYFKSHNERYYQKITRNIPKELLLKLYVKYKKNNVKDLTIAIVENYLEKEGYDRFNIIGIKRSILHVRNGKNIRSKDDKAFIEGCKLL